MVRAYLYRVREGERDGEREGERDGEREVTTMERKRQEKGGRKGKG